MSRTYWICIRQLLEYSAIGLLVIDPIARVPGVICDGDGCSVVESAGRVLRIGAAATPLVGVGGAMAQLGSRAVERRCSRDVEVRALVALCRCILGSAAQPR